MSFCGSFVLKYVTEISLKRQKTEANYWKKKKKVIKWNVLLSTS